MARGGERDVAGGRLGALSDDLDDLVAHGFEVDPEALQPTCGDPFTLMDEAEQYVLGADVVVVEEAGLFLSQDDYAAGPVREPLEHAFSPLYDVAPGISRTLR